jgi:hypothetical protein
LEALPATPDDESGHVEARAAAAADELLATGTTLVETGAGTAPDFWSPGLTAADPRLPLF